MSIEEMPDGTETIEVTPGAVISAEFLLDAGDEDPSGALHKLAANNGEHSEVSFRPEDPTPEQIIDAYRREYGRQ